MFVFTEGAQEPKAHSNMDCLPMTASAELLDFWTSAVPHGRCTVSQGPPLWPRGAGLALRAAQLLQRWKAQQ